MRSFWSRSVALKPPSCGRSLAVGTNSARTHPDAANSSTRTTLNAAYNYTYNQIFNNINNNIINFGVNGLTAMRLLKIICLAYDRGSEGLIRS